MQARAPRHLGPPSLHWAHFLISAGDAARAARVGNEPQAYRRGASGCAWSSSAPPRRRQVALRNTTKKRNQDFALVLVLVEGVYIAYHRETYDATVIKTIAANRKGLRTDYRREDWVPAARGPGLAYGPSRWFVYGMVCTRYHPVWFIPYGSSIPYGPVHIRDAFVYAMVHPVYEPSRGSIIGQSAEDKAGWWRWGEPRQ